MARSRIGYIDGLRGVAALLVVFQHTLVDHIQTAGRPLQQILRSTLVDYNDFGRVGVVAFFAISGFVIPFSFSSSRPIEKFTVARLFRIYPAYWVSLAAALAASTFIHADQAPLLQILANFTMIQEVLRQPNLLFVYWTLFVEILFYVLCAFLFARNVLKAPRILATLSITLVITSIILGMIGMAYHRHVPVMPYLFYLSVMLFGTLTRQYLLEHDATARTVFPWVLAVIVIGNPIMNYLDLLEIHRAESLYAGIMSCYIGLALFLSCCVYKLFRSAVWQFFGKISYSLYLVHIVCLHISERIFGTSYNALAPDLLLTVCGSIILSTLIYWLVERPAIRAGKALSSWLTANTRVDRPGLVGG